MKQIFLQQILSQNEVLDFSVENANFKSIPALSILNEEIFVWSKAVTDSKRVITDKSNPG